MTLAAHAYTEAIIPALPEPLRRVPEDRARWEAWRDAIIEYRALILKQAEHDKQVQADLKALCADDPAYFLTVFGFLWEPRTSPDRPAGKIPFIPFPKQVQVIRHFCDRMNDYENPDAWYPKSRGFGLSWTICGVADHGLLFKSPWDFGMASRTEEYVDKPNFKKALFWKCDFILDNLPAWMLPDGFTTKRGTAWRGDMRITNVANGNSITGESATGNLFRGDRLTAVYVDEATTFPDFANAYDTIEGVTDHRAAGSTEKGQSEFHRMWTLQQQAAPLSVLEINWSDNLYFDDAWYRRTRKRYEEQGRLPAFRQEYERDETAWSGELIYPMAKRLETGAFPYVPRAGQLYVWIDPGIRDATAIHWVQFYAATGRYRLLDTYENAGKTATFYASILAATPVSGPEGFAYDEHDYAVMDFVRTLTDPIIYVGDPYGRNRSGDGRATFYSTLSDDARDLSGGKTQISVITSYAPDDTSYTGRRDALATMLPKIDFNDTPQVRITMQALKEHAYKVISAGRQIINPGSEPVHGWGSHRVTAMEFGATQQRGGRSAGSTGRAKPQRVGMNGKPLGHRSLGLSRPASYAGWRN